MTSPKNPTFDAILSRTAVRRFRDSEVSDHTLIQLLELANHSPSGFNLQPWHFIIVRSPELRQLLRHIAMDQPQVAEAPATVVFVADPDAWKTSYPRLLELGLKSGRMTPQHIESNRKLVRLLFKNGPLGLFGFGKRIVVPIRRLFRPTPTIVTSRTEAIHYVQSQTMLAAATFMIAAKSAGLDTSPMEGFDEYRLKKLLAIPSSMTVPIIVSIGHPLNPEAHGPNIRLPLEEKVSIDLFPNLIKKPQ